MLGANLDFPERAVVAAGPLAPLAASLSADLDRLLPDEDVFVPAEKAKMTRRGGRCERDGTFLEFDPKRPRLHRCPSCGTMYEGEEHYRWWIMGYQLWLAERVVHASALWRLAGTPRHQRLAEAILHKLADRYLSYPNEDNVLGPTRVFFSTYLESIWSLQLSVAVWLLEDGSSGATGDRIRERILQPSTNLVSQFDEGLSNRQVWNSAAIGAAGLQLARPDLVERALLAPGGLQDFLRSGLLADGSWYEGENYHLFAHRGLWYLAMLAEREGAVLPADLMDRFDTGFAAPIRTALPDFTFPSRRDSPYRASLRQWRIAESLELGLARCPDSVELAGGLARVYGDAPAGDNARWRSTAEAEHNVPGARLTRADLGWKSLLFALPGTGEPLATTPRSALMAGQGFGVMRRDEGRVYVALDYGHAGGSHGHPDRLNLWLVVGDRRVFEDVGTGSYVERTLHWYRSTLAHNAPLIDGHSQDPVAGSLRAWDEQDDYAWIDAEASIAGDVLVRRTLVTGPGYLVDRLEWNAKRDVTLDLPFHVDGEIPGAQWAPGELKGGTGLEDGFDFLEHTATAVTSVPARVSADGVHGSVHADGPHEWWRAVAPGPPGTSPRRFLLVRARGQRGCLTSAWCWSGPVELRVSHGASLEVNAPSGHCSHELVDDRWSVRSSTVVLTLDGRRQRPRRPDAKKIDRLPEAGVIPSLQHDVDVGDLSASGQGLRFDLGESHYRRTEATWKEAGSPAATVVLAATKADLVIEVAVVSATPNFVAPAGDNPLDNEHPDINSDGVQLHLSFKGLRGETHQTAWLLVPEPGSSSVRINERNASRLSLRASWQRTRTGWLLMARLDRGSIAPGARFGLDVIVNEMPPGRERRRGQLVLGGGGGWAYLRGDRQESERLLPFVVKNA